MMDDIASYLDLGLKLVLVLALGVGAGAVWLRVVRRMLHGPWDRLLRDRPLLTMVAHAARWPAVLIVAIVCVTTMVSLLERHFDASYQHYVSPAVYVVFLIAVTVFLIVLMRRGCAHVIPRLVRPEMPSWRAQNIVRVVSHILGIAVVIAALLVALPQFGVDITGLLAFGGAGGLVIGFASKDVLANLFHCLTLYFDRPYAVGDHIICRGQDIEGTVQSLSWRTTHIKTFDRRMLYVPNGLFINSAIENRSRLTHRRLREVIGLRYEDAGKMREVTGQVEDMLRAHPDIDNEAGILVYFNAFSASSLDFFIYAFTRRVEWREFHALKHEILLNIVQVVESCGAEFAFPTQTVHLSATPATGNSA